MHPYNRLLLSVLLLATLAPRDAIGQAPAPPTPVPQADDSSVALLATQIGLAMAGALLLDGAARQTLAADDPASLHRLSHLGNHLGRGDKIAVLLAATYGGTRLAGVDAVSRPVGRTLAALVAAGAANGAMKFAVGRGRPITSEPGTERFRHFSLEDRWQSFPSGHTMSAFALAGAISEQADRPLVTGAAFGTAALVGWSRIHEDRHWASDVVGGAILGTVISRWTVRALEDRATPAGARNVQLLTNPLADARIYATPFGLVVVIPTR